MVTYIDLAALILAVLSFTLIVIHARTYARFVDRVNRWSANADKRIEHLGNLGHVETDPKTGAVFNRYHPAVQKRLEAEKKKAGKGQP